jgi:hypothetical protein
VERPFCAPRHAGIQGASGVSRVCRCRKSPTASHSSDRRSRTASSSHRHQGGSRR